MRLQQKCLEAVFDVEFLSGRAGVITTTRTPAIQGSTLLMEFFDVLYVWYGNAFRAVVPNKRFIHIHKNVKRSIHGLVRFS